MKISFTAPATENVLVIPVFEGNVPAGSTSPALAAFIASNSALVGKSRRGFAADFLAGFDLDFAGAFLAAVFLTAFLTAIRRKPQLR